MYRIFTSILGASLTESTDGCRPSCFRPRRDNERLMVPQSVGKLASAWNTCLLRMMVYTKLALPSIKKDTISNKEGGDYHTLY